MVEEMAAGSGSVRGSESGGVMLIGRSWFKMAEAVGDGPAGGAPTGRPMGRTKTSPRGVPTPTAADTMVAPSLFEPGQPGRTSVSSDQEAGASSKVALVGGAPPRRVRLSWSLLGLVFASSLSASAITAAVILRLRPMPIAVAIPASPAAGAPAVVAPEPVAAPAIVPPPASAPPSEPAAAPVAAEPVQPPAANEPLPSETPRPAAPTAARRARTPTAERRAASARAADSPEPAGPAPSTWVDPFAD